MVSCFVVVATAGVWGSPTRGFRPGWGCPPERIGYSIFDDFGQGRGDPEEISAVSDLLPTLARDGAVPLVRLEDAVHRPTGPSSFDRMSGELRIDGLIQARIGVGQQKDGTWVVANLEQCMRPPAGD
jgi:hypothetical protein